MWTTRQVRVNKKREQPCRNMEEDSTHRYDSSAVAMCETGHAAAAVALHR